MDDFLKILWTGLATITIALVTVFSDKIIERIRLALNRANLRIKQYEEMAQSIGEFVFLVELEYEFRLKGWDQPGVDSSWKEIDDQYKVAIKKVRRNEFVYRSWVNKFWGEKRLEEFDEIMKLVIDEVDPAIHGLKGQGDHQLSLIKLEKSSRELRKLVKTWLVRSEA